MSLPSGWLSVSPARVTPIHLSVCTEPSGLMSETYPSLGTSSCGIPALTET